MPDQEESPKKVKRLIPVPPEFPVTWEDPEDENIRWYWDREHFPYAAPPLEGDFWRQALRGFNLSGEELELMFRLDSRCINGYLYMGNRPRYESGEEEDRKKRAGEKAEAYMARMEALWETEWLPEIQDHLAFWDGYDLEGAAKQDLLDHLDETWDRILQLWRIHFLCVMPAYGAMGKLNELYGELFEDGSAFDAPRLYQGFHNKTLELGHKLWGLANQAAADSKVGGVFETRAVEEIPATLEKTVPGHAFFFSVHTFLDTYGHRGDWWGPMYPSWLEDPAPVFKTLKDYVTDLPRDPREELAELAAEREQAIEDVRERLKGYPRQTRERFEFLLEAARVGVVLSEDHGFWIDFATTDRVRQVLLECGRRFSEAGVIENREDVFYLGFEEVRETLSAFPEVDRRDLVREHRAEFNRFAAIDPPPELGTKEVKEDEEAKSPEPEEEPNLLKGQSGSPGKARGPARIIRSIPESSRLQKGDILVAESTSPPWTPLFATVAGVVTHTGGILSHGAVVAREYRVPAVVGVRGATSRLEDGQLIEIDGDAGEVRILDTD